MDESLYDEFGNYVGPPLEGEGDEQDEDLEVSPSSAALSLSSLAHAHVPAGRALDGRG